MSTLTTTTQQSQNITHSLLDWNRGKELAMKELADRVVMLQNTVPKNEMNFPIYYVDCAPILEMGIHRSTEHILQDPPAEAFIPLQYHEGFPTVNGLPFWERLDGEFFEYYDLFKKYREIIYSDLKTVTRAHNEYSVRSFFLVAKETGIKVQIIRTLANIYHWNLRAKAYDIYKKVRIEAAKQREIMVMENKHAEAARRIFAQCEQFLMNNMEQMDPKTALQWFKTAVQLERLSLGLPPEAPVQQHKNQGQPMINVNTRVQSLGTHTHTDSGIIIEGIDPSEVSPIAPPSSNGTDADGADLDNMEQVLQVLYESGALNPKMKQNEKSKVKTETDEDTNTGEIPVTIEVVPERAKPLDFK